MVLWLTEKARASSASAGMRSPTFHLPDRIMDSMAVSTWRDRDTLTGFFNSIVLDFFMKS